MMTGNTAIHIASQLQSGAPRKAAFLVAVHKIGIPPTSNFFNENLTIGEYPSGRFEANFDRAQYMAVRNHARFRGSAWFEMNHQVRKTRIDRRFGYGDKCSILR
jgi:hypothetical protein